MENYINVIAGRPGAGKTIWACNEAASLASDPNNTVVYIGHMEEFERIVRKAGADKKNLFFARLSNAGEAIGRAIDLANTYSGVFNKLGQGFPHLQAGEELAPYPIYCGRPHCCVI